MQFVIVDGDGDKQFEKSEVCGLIMSSLRSLTRLVNSTSQDPGWVRLHGIPLDYRCATYA